MLPTSLSKKNRTTFSYKIQSLGKKPKNKNPPTIGEKYGFPWILKLKKFLLLGNVEAFPSGLILWNPCSEENSRFYRASS